MSEMGTLLAERIDEFVEQCAAERYAEGLAQGLEEGRKRGRELVLEPGWRLLSRQVEHKFGAETAGRLAVLMARIDGAERLATVADAVIDCADGAELLRRVARGTDPG